MTSIEIDKSNILISYINNLNQNFCFLYMDLIRVCVSYLSFKDICISIHSSPASEIINIFYESLRQESTQILLKPEQYYILHHPAVTIELIIKNIILCNTSKTCFLCYNRTFANKKLIFDKLDFIRQLIDYKYQRRFNSEDINTEFKNIKLIIDILFKLKQPYDYDNCVLINNELANLQYRNYLPLILMGNHREIFNSVILKKPFSKLTWCDIKYNLIDAFMSGDSEIVYFFLNNPFPVNLHNSPLFDGVHTPISSEKWLRYFEWDYINICCKYGDIHLLKIVLCTYSSHFIKGIHIETAASYGRINILKYIFDHHKNKIVVEHKDRITLNEVVKYDELETLTYLLDYNETNKFQLKINYVELLISTFLHDKFHLFVSLLEERQHIFTYHDLIEVFYYILRPKDEYVKKTIARGVYYVHLLSCLISRSTFNNFIGKWELIEILEMRDEYIFKFMSDNKIVLNADFRWHYSNDRNQIFKNIFCDWDFNVALYFVRLSGSYPHFTEISLFELSEKYHNEIYRYLSKNKNLLSVTLFCETIISKDIKMIERLIDIKCPVDMSVLDMAIRRGTQTIVNMVRKMLDNNYDPMEIT